MKCIFGLFFIELFVGCVLLLDPKNISLSLIQQTYDPITPINIRLIFDKQSVEVIDPSYYKHKRLYVRVPQIQNSGMMLK